MSDRRHRLLSPLHCAAYLTWATVLASLFVGGFNEPAGGGHGVRVAVVALMLVFLAGFVFDSWWSSRSPHRIVSVAVLAIQVLATLALVALTRDGSAPVLLIIVVAQAVELPHRWLIALVVAANLGLLAVLLSAWPLPSALIVCLLFLGFQAFAGLTGYYAKQAERSRDELAQVNAHLLATRSLLEESARDGERLRLARELHDVAGHKLTAMKLQLALLARGPGGAPPAVATAAGLAGELLDDLRGVVGQLRRHQGLDLKRAIEELAAPLPRPRVHIEIAEDARVDDVVQAQALLRTAQEALTNAARHSGADHVWLRLAREDGRIVLEVRDDGRGSATIRPGNGLAGMRERLEALGGGVVLCGKHGFRVDAWVPLA
ncbi:sensor histidine kinase [Dokdonella sp.]|uniref:sensor histidine kinase n=1 Tax=Dokdonella sp. TaxID=2291710 RepID=UPI001B241BA5|nr:sensor histidine kinase [Dokdonella sp.]MBO9661520.1 sensor histidine kinase [Dokdonella sp.]